MLCGGLPSRGERRVGGGAFERLVVEGRWIVGGRCRSLGTW